MFSGKVKVYKTGTNGKENILKLASAGDVLGYQNFLMESGYSATAEVIEDTTVCFIDRNYFTQLLSKSADLAFKIIHRLGQELADANNRLSDQLNKPVRQRMSNLLLTLAKTHGRTGNQGIVLDIRLSRAEMAAMIGATPETVIRLLSDFQDSGYIQLAGKEIAIMDKQGLLNETGISI